jgi:hypothetical protein
MATYKHLRSSTANKRPTTSITDGQLAINTNTASPGLFFKDSAGTGIVKVGPVHVGTTAPNATPAAGGSSGNYLGEQWLDTSVSPAQMKVWNGSAWVGIVADELPVSKLQDGDARQLLQTDAAGTGVEWTSNVDVPGTLDVTSTATFDSIARHPLGSAAAPTLTFTGDPNTGIYSPGADQVAVATNGTGRLFVDASGTTLFHVYTDSPTTISAPTICLEGGPNAYGAGVDFASRTSAGGTLVSMAKITADGEAPWNTTASTQDAGLRFFTAADGSLSERLRITSAGAVGIGTSSPSSQLDIRGSATNFDGIRVINTDGGSGGATTAAIRLGITNSIGIRNTRIEAVEGSADSNSVHLDFYTNSANALDSETVKMRLTSGGALGIGTTSPSDTSGFGGTLDINGTTGAACYVRTNGSATDYGLIGHYGADFYVNNNSNGPIRFFANGDERARIDSSGRLLVGTSSTFDQSARLQVIVDTGTSVAANFYSYGADNSQFVIGAARGTVASPTTLNSSDTIGGVYFRGHDGTSFKTGAQIQAQIDGITPSSDLPSRLVFSTTADGAASPTERMRITSAGVFKASNTGSYLGSTSGVHEIRNNTDNNNVLIISSAASNGTQYGVSIRTADDQNDATRDFLECQGGGVLRAQIRSNGGLANYSANNANLSDRNAKKDISPAADTWDCIKEWEIVNYRYKDQSDDADLNLGVIAQQVAESCPEVITVFQEAKEAIDDQPAQEERLGVKEQQMYWMAIKALQEAQVRIEQLESKVAALESA